MLGNNGTWIDGNRAFFDRVMAGLLLYQTIADANEQFAGLQLIIEPHQQETWEDDRNDWLQKKIDFAVSVIDEFGSQMTIDWIIPPYWTDPVTDTVDHRGTSRLAYQALIHESDRISVMAFCNSAESIVDFAKDVLVYARSQNKEAILMVTIDYDFRPLGHDVMMAELGRLGDVVDAEIGSMDIGIAVHSIATWYDMVFFRDAIFRINNNDTDPIRVRMGTSLIPTQLPGDNHSLVPHGYRIREFNVDPIAHIVTDDVVFVAVLQPMISLFHQGFHLLIDITPEVYLIDHIDPEEIFYGHPNMQTNHAFVRWNHPPGTQLTAGMNVTPTFHPYITANGARVFLTPDVVYNVSHLVSPTQRGYRFIGWSINGIDILDSDFALTPGMTLHAMWEEAPTSWWWIVWVACGILGAILIAGIIILKIRLLKKSK